MRRFVLALALVCALSVTALAGEIHSTGATPAPAPGDTQGSNVVATIILTILNIAR